MTDKNADAKKMIDKMRTNTEKQQRRTESRPLRRSRIKVPKGRKDNAESEKPAFAPVTAPPSSGSTS